MWKRVCCERKGLGQNKRKIWALGTRETNHLVEEVLNLQVCERPRTRMSDTTRMIQETRANHQKNNAVRGIEFRTHKGRELRGVLRRVRVKVGHRRVLGALHRGSCAPARRGSLEPRVGQPGSRASLPTRINPTKETVTVRPAPRASKKFLNTSCSLSCRRFLRQKRRSLACRSADSPRG